MTDILKEIGEKFHNARLLLDIAVDQFALDERFEDCEDHPFQDHIGMLDETVARFKVICDQMVREYPEFGRGYVAAHRESIRKGNEITEKMEQEEIVRQARSKLTSIDGGLQ